MGRASGPQEDRARRRLLGVIEEERLLCDKALEHGAASEGLVGRHLMAGAAHGRVGQAAAVLEGVRLKVSGVRAVDKPGGPRLRDLNRVEALLELLS